MAVGFVASASSGSQASVASFSIGTLGTGARAGIVFVATHNDSSDIITSVTWNSVAMTRLYRAVDTDTEPGSVVAYFLDNVTNGTITVNRTNNAVVTVGYAASISAAASRGLEVAQTITRAVSTQNTNADTSSSGTGASGEVAVDDGSPGTDSMRFAAAYSGAATPPLQGTNSTNLQVLDSTAFGSRFVRETTAGQGSRNVGFATGTTDDWALVAVAVREQIETPAAEAAAGTGAASNAAIGEGLAPTTATGTGAASNASLAEGITGGQATGTGAASSAITALGITGGQASGTGAANDATVSTAAAGTEANAELASGTGAASAPSEAIAFGGRSIGDLSARARVTLNNATCTYGILLRASSGNTIGWSVALNSTTGVVQGLIIRSHPTDQLTLATVDLSAYAYNQEWTIDFDVSGPAATPNLRARFYPSTGSPLAFTTATDNYANVPITDDVDHVGVFTTEVAFTSWGAPGGWGSAWEPILRVGPASAIATGAGTASDASVVSGIAVAAGAASGTGTAFNAKLAIALGPDVAAGVGAAYDATGPTPTAVIPPLGGIMRAPEPVPQVVVVHAMTARGWGSTGGAYAKADYPEDELLLGLGEME